MKLGVLLNKVINYCLRKTELPVRLRTAPTNSTNQKICSAFSTTGLAVKNKKRNVCSAHFRNELLEQNLGTVQKWYRGFWHFCRSWPVKQMWHHITTKKFTTNTSTLTTILVLHLQEQNNQYFKRHRQWKCTGLVRNQWQKTLNVQTTRSPVMGCSFPENSEQPEHVAQTDKRSNIFINSEFVSAM